MSRNPCQIVFAPFPNSHTLQNELSFFSPQAPYYLAQQGFFEFLTTNLKNQGQAAQRGFQHGQY